ncbi:hypothetical protein SAMN05421858_5057 [Haladaptatus litoreus]|uniref:Right handed beta helix region n=1 Tax=Haladaptatus litoreus TaxID=553468 RepID=A0A1N7FHA1_9EURY|nr:hypothetical protein [Haladaptatus litoreus]SIR99732.1 hypothetical protein SAMN05421858_5057 [Haladaptatus litoreus]
MPENITTVDVRAKGADTSGHEPIDDLLTDHEHRDRTRYVFPPGRYRLAEPFEAFDWGESLEFVGEGRPTFVIEDQFDKPIFNFGYSSGNRKPGNHLRFEGFNIDITEDGVGQPPLWALAKYGLDVHNVRVFGERSADGSPLSSTIFGILRETGRGEINRLDMPFGAEHRGKKDQTHEAIGLNIVKGKHNGLLRIKNSYIAEHANNGFYVYRHSTGGNVHVRNCISRNNGLTAFRIDAGDTCKDSNVLIDMDDLPYDGACGLWSQGGGKFENIHIKRESGQNKLIRDTQGNITESFKNITIDNAGDGDILNLHFPGGKWVCDGLTVRDTNDDPGDQNDYFTSRIKRDNVVLKNVEYSTQGDKRRGIHFEDSKKIKVEDSHFDVHEVALNFKDCENTVVDDWNEYLRGAINR